MSQRVAPDEILRCINIRSQRGDSLGGVIINPVGMTARVGIAEAGIFCDVSYDGARIVWRDIDPAGVSQSSQAIGNLYGNQQILFERSGREALHRVAESRRVNKTAIARYRQG
jgi:hypothetical protein